MPEALKNGSVRWLGPVVITIAIGVAGYSGTTRFDKIEARQQEQWKRVNENGIAVRSNALKNEELARIALDNQRCVRDINKSLQNITVVQARMEETLGRIRNDITEIKRVK